MAVSSVAPVSLTTDLTASGAALTETVLTRYACWNEEEVREFLRRHAEINHVLLHAADPLEAVFGKGTNVTLQVLDDHDGENDVVLKAWIQTPDTVETALEKRRQFDRHWWSAARLAVQGLLRFDVDCL